MESLDLSEIWAREREFHDALARELDAGALDHPWPAEGLEGEMARMAGDLAGARVLDLGCGQGDLTMHLLRAGADVTALDVSPGMVDLVAHRAERLGRAGARLTCLAAPFERSGLPDGAFDLVLGRWVLHHLDLATAGRELRRLVSPGGRAIFIETSGENRLLALARRRLAGRYGVPRYGTADEHPLLRTDLEALDEIFPAVRFHYPEFVFLSLFDRQVFRYRWAGVSRVMCSLDRAVWRGLPSVRRFSYYFIIELAA